MIPTVGFNMRKVTKGKVRTPLPPEGPRPRAPAVRALRSEAHARPGAPAVLPVAQVTIKLWDLGGQPRFRSMWERYCRGVSAIVYVVDAADGPNMPAARSELHDLVSKPALASIPLLVLGNKNDLPGALSSDELIEALGLRQVGGREVCCYSISAKNHVNIDLTIEWLIKYSRAAR